MNSFNMATEEYKNYDFGRKWDSEVFPHLQTEEFKKLFRSIRRRYKRIYPGANVSSDSPPAYLSTGDALSTLSDSLVQYELKYKERLTKNERKLQKICDSFTEEEWEDGDGWETNRKLEDSILSRINLDWESNKDHLAFYIPMGQCFLWNRHFGLWLAKKVCPKEKWVVEESKEHCTVVCHESKRIFDILYWSLENRLEDYCKYHAGQTNWKRLRYTSKDKTLGGKEAYESTRTQPKPKAKSKGSCFCTGSKAICEMISLGSLTKCCWCSDKRTAKEIKDPEIYVDNVGYVHPLKYGIKYPKDIGYCPKCKKTKVKSTVLCDQILAEVRCYYSDSE